jgi:hypothetical protein
MLPFAEQSLGRERLFKRLNLGLMLLALAALTAGTARGRDAVMSLVSTARAALMWSIGVEPGRAEAEARWRRQRLRSIENTRATYQTFYERESPPQLRRILDEAGMAPEDALFRWANYDRTVVLSSRVFAPDDAGRSYRMLPNVRSFWMRGQALPRGLSSFFFLPDLPRVRSAVDDAHIAIIPESFQTTNSWGCRGAEPDANAEVRGLVIGDSFMQGIFVADDQTPPACLERVLRSRWERDVSVLNTGHIGYSPEQYSHTLEEFFARFHPHFVLVSVCPNDFGDGVEVTEHGKGDWAEGAYWLGEIDQFCRVRDVPCFLVPAPIEAQVNSVRKAGNYPGQVTNKAWPRGNYYVDPIEAFVDEHLRLMKVGEKAGKRPSHSPLFNGPLADGHFSAKGCQLWAEVVGRRVALLFEPRPRR